MRKWRKVPSEELLRRFRSELSGGFDGDGHQAVALDVEKLTPVPGPNWRVLRVASDFNNSHRVGAFFYDGSDDVTTSGGDVTYAHRKVGADFDLRFAHEGITLYGLYLWGRDRAPEESRSNGGWIQFEKQTTRWLLLTSRYTHLSLETRNEDNLALGTQLWFYERLRFAFEYRFQRGDRPDNGSFIIDFVL